MSIERVVSGDGTQIGFVSAGEGPPVILVGGAFCDRNARASGTPLAALLASRFRVVAYDRRGRGDSAAPSGAPYAPEREVEDLAALIERAGERVHLYGISSGALLAMEAALAGLPIGRLALYEPPIQLDPARRGNPEELASELEHLVVEGRRGDAAATFLTKVVQLPPPAVAGMRQAPFWAGLETLAHTLAFDVRLMARVPSLMARAPGLRAEVLALHGEASPPWMREGVEALARAVPGATARMLAGQTHDVDVRVLAGALVEFFAG